MKQNNLDILSMKNIGGEIKHTIGFINSWPTHVKKHIVLQTIVLEIHLEGSTERKRDDMQKSREKTWKID